MCDGEDFYSRPTAFIYEIYSFLIASTISCLLVHRIVFFPKQVRTINDQIKVVLASGFAIIDVETSKSGYDKIIQLPVTMSELVTIVREVLS